MLGSLGPLDGVAGDEFVHDDGITEGFAQHRVQIADEIILCASELAANAVLHSNSRHPGGTFTVHAEISAGHHVRIEVADNGGPWTSDTTGSTGHHGLDIVRVLATDWGINSGHATRTIWAQFDWPGRS